MARFSSLPSSAKLRELCFRCVKETSAVDIESVARMLDTMHYQLQAVPAEQRDLWDRFVSEHPQGHLLQSWHWGELKSGAGWSPLRLALWDTEQQGIVAGAQVLRRTA